MRLLICALALWSCSFWGGCAASKGPSDMAAATAQVQAAFDTWLASPAVQKQIAEKKLAGDYVYTVIVDYHGQVQTVYADDNAEDKVLARQNEMTRLLRTFRCAIKLNRQERVKFQSKFKV